MPARTRYGSSNLVGCPAVAGLRGHPGQPNEPDPGHAGGGRRDAQSATQPARDDVPQIAAALLDAPARARPRVHCITNAVAQNFTANVLLAAGCVPSMTLSRRGDRRLRRPRACAAGQSRHLRPRAPRGHRDRGRNRARGNVPWVLDPVFVDRSAPRAAFARELVATRAQGGAAQSRRIFRAGRRRADARCAGGLCARARNRASGCRARPIWSPTASGSRPSPTVIR